MHPPHVLISAVLAVWMGCGGASTEMPIAPDVAVESAAVVLGPPVKAQDVRAAIVDLQTLQGLEAPQRGASFGAVVARAQGQEVPTTSKLSSLWEDNALYRALSDTLSQDIDGVIDGVNRPLVREHADAMQWPAGNVGRALDVRWLKSPDAFLSLAGVINRLDRRDLHGAPSCGEVRLIYRLAYQVKAESGSQSSRLPLTINVVLTPAERTECAATARAWSGLMDGPDLAKQLTDGPLDFSKLVLDRFEVNAQVVRFPSGLETQFGGQAIYLLKVYGPTETKAGVVAQPLENTPDVGRIQASAQLRSELVAWVSDNIEDIDRGTYRLPEKFLATAALSYSTLGINRLANKPFSALFEGDLRAALPEPTGALSWIGSRRGLVERLDNGSCTGCHQAGSTAGFHLLGPDDPKLAGVTNRLAAPISPHLSTDLRRRRAYVADVASGRTPQRYRPHSLTPATTSEGLASVALNQACIPQAARANLQDGARWACDQSGGPAQCQVVASDPRSAMNFGQCMVPAENPGSLAAGMTCREAEIHASLKPDSELWNQHAYADTVKQQLIYDLPEDPPFTADSLHCRPTRIGVPLGRTYRRCTSGERRLTGAKSTAGTPSDICAVVGGAKFDLCVEGDFHKCMAQIIGRGMVARCSSTQPCREDAICQVLPWQLEGVPTDAGRVLTEQGVGFCTPTYFLFQLRLDGHPTPRAAL